MKNPVSNIVAALSAITDNLVRIPRLMLMVGQLVARQDDPQHTVDTLTLAKSIFDAPSKTVIENLINDSSVTSNSTTNALGSCVEYSDDDVFGVAVFYYMWRNVKCGLVQRILDRVDPAASTRYFDRDGVETEDVEVAGRLAMSIDFAFRQQTLRPPFNTLKTCTPMMISYGASDKLQKRHEKIGNTGVMQHAADMKGLVCESHNRATRLWHMWLPGQEKIKRICGAYSRGRLCLYYLASARRAECTHKVPRFCHK